MGLINRKELQSNARKVNRSKHGSLEYQLQCKCVQWFKAHYPEYLIFQVPNEATHKNGEKFHKSGTLNGVSDLIIVKDKQILFIEMKSEKGVQRREQVEFEFKVRELGFEYYIVRDFDTFKKIICSNP